MRTVILLFVSVICISCRTVREVHFVYFNLSRNQIYVDDVTGLPSTASPGILVPVSDEEPLKRAESVLFDPASINPSIKIVWKEAGVLHQVEFSRQELGIP